HRHPTVPRDRTRRPRRRRPPRHRPGAAKDRAALIRRPHFRRGGRSARRRPVRRSRTARGRTARGRSARTFGGERERPAALGPAAFTARLAEGLSAAGHATTADQAASGLAAGRIRHKEWKAAHESVNGGPVPEIDPVTFWAELVGPELPGDPDAVAAWLHAEAHRLMYDYSRVKSARTLRPGIVELLRTAGDLGIPVGIVSNTVSGRGIRS